MKHIYCKVSNVWIQALVRIPLSNYNQYEPWKCSIENSTTTTTPQNFISLSNFNTKNASSLIFPCLSFFLLIFSSKTRKANNHLFSW